MTHHLAVREGDVVCDDGDMLKGTVIGWQVWRIGRPLRMALRKLDLLCAQSHPQKPHAVDLKGLREPRIVNEHAKGLKAQTGRIKCSGVFQMADIAADAQQRRDGHGKAAPRTFV